MPDTRLRETYRGVVYPWLCDAMGHLTTRHYMAMFDDAGWHLMLHLGCSAKAMKRERRGWADVKHEIEYLREIRDGELLVVRSMPVRVGTKSLVCRHEMREAEDEELCATLTATTVRFHLDERKAIPLEPELAQKAKAWIG